MDQKQRGFTKILLRCDKRGGGTSPVLILNEPPAVTSAYEVLEPETWVGREMPILEHIDIGEQLKEGNWLVVLYHHDCPACAEALPKIEAMAREMAGNEEFLRFALVEVPPYCTPGLSLISEEIPCILGKMDNTKKWFVMTPAITLVQEKTVRNSWKEYVPILKELIDTFEQAGPVKKERKQQEDILPRNIPVQSFVNVIIPG